MNAVSMWVLPLFVTVGRIDVGVAGSASTTRHSRKATTMYSVHFTAETSSNGVIERDFTVGEVTGVLWSPASGSDRAAAGADGPRRRHAQEGAGDGGPGPAPRDRRRFPRRLPSTRPDTAAVRARRHDEQEIAALRRAMAAGEPVGPIVVRYNADLAERAVPEWQATLDALQELPEIGTEGPVGYFGLNMGTAIGVPLTAVEPRITAAVFGIFWHRSLAATARQITVPVEFVAPVGRRAHRPRSGLALFDAFASRKRRCTPTRAGTRRCPDSRPTARSGSSSGTSARPSRHRHDLGRRQLREVGSRRRAATEHAAAELGRGDGGVGTSGR